MHRGIWDEENIEINRHALREGMGVENQGVESEEWERENGAMKP